MLVYSTSVFFYARPCCGRCGWHQNASILPVWGHRQHCIKDGIDKRRWRWIKGTCNEFIQVQIDANEHQNDHWDFTFSLDKTKNYNVYEINWRECVWSLFSSEDPGERCHGRPAPHTQRLRSDVPRNAKCQGNVFFSLGFTTLGRRRLQKPEFNTTLARLCGNWQLAGVRSFFYTGGLFYPSVVKPNTAWSRGRGLMCASQRTTPISVTCDLLLRVSLSCCSLASTKP